MINMPIVRGEKLIESVDKFVNSLNKNDEVEKAIVYNPDGSVFIKERIGTKNYVEYAHEEYLQMRGKILIHNHVDTGDLTDRVLSPDDLHRATYYGMGKIQAITLNSSAAFSPGMILSGNVSMRDQFLKGYAKVFETGKAHVSELLGDEPSVAGAIQNTARNMSDYLKENQHKYGYRYDERGIFE